MENFEALDKMMGLSPKLWDSYESIVARLEKESNTRTQGDQEESLSEKGLI